MKIFISINFLFYYFYCICEQVIPQTGKICFAFEYCWVGNGFRAMVIQNGYRNVDNGQGTYLLRYSSSSFFYHSNNTQGKPFEFKVNDLVIVEMSLEQKYIKWSKKNSQDYLITKIDTSQFYIFIHVCFWKIQE
ncbi:unnamed protein product [Paramecium sonneborni]|uniref:Uncharacterized protein n=1 Tax=Paramecium sonneborni TaxID=65129 RepID=A0A8S1RPJ7_9CILI|nr:unnamed protein product [Paramecium sonneborni]